MSRREFLKSAAAIAAAAALGSLSGPPAFSMAATPQPWKDHPFEGENWTNCHKLRDSMKFPTAAAATRTVDVVVVGGGVSGITATYQLRDLDVLLLDKGTTPGGNSRLGTWEGIDYPLGAMYISKPEGHVKALLADAGIHPVEIPRPADSININGHIAHDLFGDAWKELPYSKEVRQAWKDACEHFAAYSSSKDTPLLPIEKTSRKSLDLDRLTFYDYMLDHRIHPVAMELLEDYTRSDFGAGSKRVSAFAAINFLASEFEATYGFPGGNGGFSRAMAPKIAVHTQENCFVHRVEAEGKYVRVHYLQNGKPQNVRARSAIMATPHNIAVKVVQNVSAARLSAALELRYGSYIMGVTYLSAPVCDHAFDVWSRGRFYTDLMVADWIATGGRPKKQRRTVVVASIPMGENQGRDTILKSSHKDLEEKLLADMEKDYPGSRQKVLGTQFARYGHPMILAGPGFMRNMAPVLRQPEGNVFFAQSDLEGLPCLEAATWTGMQAADRARTLLTGRKHAMF